MTSWMLLMTSLLISSQLVEMSPCPSCLRQPLEFDHPIFPSITAAEEEAVKIFDSSDGEGEKKKLFTVQGENGSGMKKRLEHRHKRAITSDENKYWPKAIVPYEFNKDYSENRRKEAIIAMKRHEKYTCIRFVPWVLNKTRWDLDLPDEGHMRFVKHDACWAFVGNNHSPSGQTISCCDRTPCVHELSHILGVYHTQVSPDRQGWITVNWDNIKTSDWGIYGEMEESAIKEFRYDFTSIMHYNSQGFRAGPWPVMSLLFKEWAPLLESGGNTFYLWQEIAVTNQCKERHCPDFSMECVNDGYVSYVENECRCLCPPGLDHKTGCSSVIKKVEAPTIWPGGSFGLFSASGICPDGFSPLEYQTETRLMEESESFHLGGNITDELVDPLLCLRNSTADVAWQSGEYCILASDGVDDCPVDFQRTNINVPELNITVCCRDDGFSVEPISLPIETPFMLLPHRIAGPCQTVSGMQGNLEFVDLNIARTTVTVSSNLPININGRTQITIAFCHYTKYIEGCGGEVFLSSDKTSDVITSPGYPGNYPSPLNCYWLIKGPPNSSIVLDFDDFEVGGNITSCEGDYVEVRHGLLGQTTLKQCGNKLDRSFRSIENVMTVRLHTDHDNSYKGFKATVKAALPKNHCYNLADKGRSYRGKINFTRDFEPCLPWDQVTSCPHHLFNPSDFDSILEENFCRNPDDSFRPWCYTKNYEGQCERNYCDVCRLEKVYDVSKDCDTLKMNGFCDKNPNDVISSCAKTCSVALPKKEETFSCARPPILQDGLLTFDRPWYDVGDIVTHRCPFGPDFITRRCHSDGTWSPGNYVCGVCSNGWSSHNEACYKYFPERLTYIQARDFCALHNSFLSPANTEKELTFIGSLRPKLRPSWLGTTRIKGQKDWINTDDMKLKIGNWKSSITQFSTGDLMCASITSENSGRSFQEQNCQKNFPFVCKRVPTPRRGCVNRRWDCPSILKRNPNMCEDYPDFAWQLCPFTCGVCQSYITPYCEVASPGVNVVTNGKVLRFAPRSHVIRYSCKPGTVHLQGDLERTCEDTGWLSGTQPSCIEIDKIITPNNKVELIPRVSNTDKDRSYVGNNSLQRIHRDGEIVQWSFYASRDGTACLQVWRPRDDKGKMKFEFIGQNFLPAEANKINNVDVPLYERIQVKKDDVIGLYSGSSSPIKYNNCGSLSIPEATDNVIISKDSASFFVVSDVYEATNSGCRVFSVTAHINSTWHPFTYTSMVPIRAATRKVSHSGNLAYVISPEFGRIPTDGSVVEWRMYFQTKGEISLQVWRHIPSEGDLAYELVGQTRLTIEQPGKYYRPLNDTEQFQVKINDVIGIWFGDPPALLSYESCSTGDIPDLGPLTFLKTEFIFSEGEVTTFATTLSSCRVFPLVAIIKSDP